MARRVPFIVLCIALLMAWMLADAPTQPDVPPAQPAPEPAVAGHPMPKTPAAADLAAIDLPPPPNPQSPKPRPEPKAEPEPEPEPKKVMPLLPSRQPQPAAAVTPLKAAPKPLLKPLPENTPEKRAEIDTTPLRATVKPLRPAPAPRPAPPSQASSQPAIDAATATQEGRPLLKLMELGEGPSVEIAWPDGAAERRHLYRLFVSCYGMRTAVMTTDGQLFDAASAPGTPWRANLDRYSGFVRRSSGHGASQELQAAETIRARHGLFGTVTVRLFPRRMDALLLGGLKALAGGDYAGAGRIRARYRVSGTRVWVSAITLGGRTVSGDIDLSSGAQGRCAI